MNKLEVDVVLVNYNAAPYITTLTQAFQQDENLKIHVVDNGSTDGSLESLLGLGLVVEANKINLGFAKACNQGATKGGAPLIAFVNPDCVMSAETLRLLSNHLTAAEEVALVGCQVVNEDGTAQRGTWRRLPTFWRVLLSATGLERLPAVQGLNMKRAPEPNKARDVEAVNGACYVIKRDVFESLSGFDEAYPLHFEDLDLFARIKSSGHKLAYVDDIKVRHVKGHSSKASTQVDRWKKIGLLRYFKKHRPKWEARFIAFLVGLK